MTAPFRAKRSNADVAKMLQSLLNGTVDSGEWDYFISVETSDPALKSIRQRCVALWKKDSPFLKPGAISPDALSDAGKARVQELLTECLHVSHDSTKHT